MRGKVELLLWILCLGTWGCVSMESGGTKTVRSAYAKNILSYFSELSGDSLELKAAGYLLHELEQHRNVNWIKKESLPTSEELIPYIRKKTELLKSASWLKGISFEDFCEYLLAFQVDSAGGYMLNQNDNPLQTKFKYAIEHYDDCLLSSQQLGKLLIHPYNLHLRKETDELLPFVSYLRELGVPVSIDFFPAVSRHAKQKAWLRFWDDFLLLQPMDGAQMYYSGKVYRQTFSKQPCPKAEQGEYIPPFFRNPFQKDVTEEYLYTRDLTIDCSGIPQVKNLYLAQFNDTVWSPVAWSEVDNGYAHFQKLGFDHIYLPLYFQDPLPHSFGEPFVLLEDGQCHVFDGNDSVTDLEVTHTAHYASNSDTHNHLYSYFQFEGANDSAFKTDYVSYPLVYPHYLWEEIKVQNRKKRRYWRIFCQVRFPLHIAELQFIDSSGKQVSGAFFGPHEEYSQCMEDHDSETFTQIVGWMGVDFGKAVDVAAIRYLFPQGNRIVKGHRYELSCFRQGKWQRIDIQTAQGVSMQFKEVPENRLYRLRNLETLEYSAIFSIKNQRAYFW